MEGGGRRWKAAEGGGVACVRYADVELVAPQPHDVRLHVRCLEHLVDALPLVGAVRRPEHHDLGSG